MNWSICLGSQRVEAVERSRDDTIVAEFNRTVDDANYDYWSTENALSIRVYRGSQLHYTSSLPSNFSTHLYAAEEEEEKEEGGREEKCPTTMTTTDGDEVPILVCNWDDDDDLASSFLSSAWKCASDQSLPTLERASRDVDDAESMQDYYTSMEKNWQEGKESEGEEGEEMEWEGEGESEGEGEEEHEWGRGQMLHPFKDGFAAVSGGRMLRYDMEHPLTLRCVAWPDGTLVIHDISYQKTAY
jgi:hypothetical protein